MPIKLHQPRAKPKASLHYRMAWSAAGYHSYHPQPGARIVEFETASHAEAQRKLQTLVLPDDHRLIVGRSDVHLFVVKEANP